eukprot:1154037-Pelagomonas_calceolata.AAC.2
MDTLNNEKHAKRFHSHTGPALCPLCGAPDSTFHILLRCTNPHIPVYKMHTNRHNEALNIFGEGISKRRHVRSWLLLDHGMCSQVGDVCVTLILHDTFPNGSSHLKRVRKTTLAKSGRVH